MRVLTCGLALALVLPAALAAPARPGGNLIVNSSFEEGPDDIGEFKSLDKGSKDIKGWTVTRGQIDLIGTFWTSADGKRSLDLHGSPGFGGVTTSSMEMVTPERVAQWKPVSLRASSVAATCTLG